MYSRTQLCLNLCDPMDCSPTVSSIHGISQARIPEWVAVSYHRWSSRPRDRILRLLYLLHWQGILYHCSTWESQELFYSFILKIENLFKECWWICILCCFLDHSIKCFEIDHIAKGGRPQLSKPQLMRMKGIEFILLKANSSFVNVRIQQV